MKALVVLLIAPLALAAQSASPAAGLPVLEPGAKLFSDRDYVAEEVPAAVRGLPFLRGSIDRPEAIINSRRYRPPALCR